jgi:hypothetical protein
MCRSFRSWLGSYPRADHLRYSSGQHPDTPRVGEHSSIPAFQGHQRIALCSIAIQVQVADYQIFHLNGFQAIDAFCMEVAFGPFEFDAQLVEEGINDPLLKFRTRELEGPVAVAFHLRVGFV